jgi:hypothetical protein
MAGSDWYVLSFFRFSGSGGPQEKWKFETPLSEEQKLALAVLQGDTASALILSDMVQEKHGNIEGMGQYHAHLEKIKDDHKKSLKEEEKVRERLERVIALQDEQLSRSGIDPAW